MPPSFITGRTGILDAIIALRREANEGFFGAGPEGIEDGVKDAILGAIAAAAEGIEDGIKDAILGAIAAAAETIFPNPPAAIFLTLVVEPPFFIATAPPFLSFSTTLGSVVIILTIGLN
jgi:hypothetical protein